MTYSIIKEVDKFKLWASQHEDDHSSEWEIDYESWQSLYEAVSEFCTNNQPDELTENEIDYLLYIIARDNECETIVETLLKMPLYFVRLAKCSLKQGEVEAKWQFAAYLPDCELKLHEIEELLLKFIIDSHEYVRRRALWSLAIINSSHCENYCIKAWETENQYQRLMALSSLEEIKSPLLRKYIKEAKEDGDGYLKNRALEIESKA